MSKAVLLDACTLGMVSNPNDTADNLACQEWALDLHRKGVSVCIPEIADYEIRRELIRANKGAGSRNLTGLSRFIAISLSAQTQCASLLNSGLMPEESSKLRLMTKG